MNGEINIYRWMLVPLLSASWLLPNHTPPWMSFHSEALNSIVLFIASAGVFFIVRRGVIWTVPSVFFLAVCFIPWVQYVLGVIRYFGVAWIYSAYLFGLFFAFFAGYQWELVRKNQCADFIFLSIGCAALLSVAIQIYQCSGGEESIWIVGNAKVRPFANLGQPNQLGSLLVLGVLAVMWGAGVGWLEDQGELSRLCFC